MTEPHRFLLGYILNSVWQVPLILLVACCCAMLLRRAGFAVQHRLWVAALVAAVLLPVTSASGWFASLFGSASGHFRATTGSTMTLLLDGESSVRSFSTH